MCLDQTLFHVLRHARAESPLDLTAFEPRTQSLYCRNAKLLVNAQHASWVQPWVRADRDEFRAGFGPELLETCKRASEDNLAERTIESFADTGIDAQISIAPNEFVDAFAQAADGGRGAAICADLVRIRILDREQLGESGEAVSDLGII